jgi:DNA modification methylase
MLAFALRADGWYLRQDIIWSKPNPMPESVRDRCTKAHEYLFLLSKSARYYYDAEAIAEPVTDPSTVERLSQEGHRRAEREPSRSGQDEWHDEGSWSRWCKRFRRQGSNRDAGNGQANRDGRDMRDIGIGGTRNKRSVWEIATAPFKEAHFATFPPALVEPCIKAGCPLDGTVLDPFGGAGTTGLVADRLQRSAVLIELNPEYAAIARKRINGEAPLFAQVGT